MRKLLITSLALLGFMSPAISAEAVLIMKCNDGSSWLQYYPDYIAAIKGFNKTVQCDVGLKDVTIIQDGVEVLYMGIGTNDD